MAAQKDVINKTAVITGLLHDISTHDRCTKANEYARVLADATAYAAVAANTTDKDMQRLYDYAHLGASLRLLSITRPTRTKEGQLLEEMTP